ncbi:MAG: hypothetical protein ACXIUM_09750 [Wenzhouxiangella sp.]
MPLLVGLYLRGAVPEWTADWPESEAVTFSPGWFRSRLQWSSADGIHLDLQARHAPPLRAGLLRIDGTLRSPIMPEAADLRGHIGLTGGWNLETRAAEVSDPHGTGLRAGSVALNLAQPAGQAATLILSADYLNRMAANRVSPEMGPLRLMARHHLDDQGQRHIGLDLEANNRELGAAGLTLTAGPADPLALNELIQNLTLWAGSEPGSLDQGLALLGAAGAWQQLGAEGLVIRLERLTLSEDTRIAARWAIEQPLPQFEGGGQPRTVAAWSGAVARLAGQPAEQAEQQALAWLAELARSGWIRLQDERFELAAPAVPQHD